MELTLLGTGAASGWPNPWCTCSSCEWMRRNHEVRGQTSALLDGRLWVDCGPEAPRAAERLGHRVVDVRHLLFTHAHPDHTGAAALMWRAWTRRDDVIDVAGPPAAIDECRQWVAADAPVRWHQLVAGDVVELGSYRVRALPAHHGDASIGPALIYDITAADGTRLLWATDTAPLRADAVDALVDAAFDVVCLEQTNGDDLDADTDHLDLVTWPRQVADLRDVGAITATTKLVAIHLGHGNPPPPQLQQRMSQWGARVPDDGEVIAVRRQPRAPSSTVPRRVLVVGGARSGKSRWAESMLADRNDVTYVATALERPDDAEWQDRVRAHRDRRPSTWTTVETLDVAKAIAAHDVVLVDCASLWVGALLDEPDLDGRLDELVAAVSTARGTVVIVSNEVGSGVVPATPAGRQFRDVLGVLNARLAGACDEVWQLTAGIAQRLV